MIGKTGTRTASAVRAVKENGQPKRRLGRDPRLFEALLNASPDPVFVIDPKDLLFVEANPAACHSLGYSREELLSMGPLQIRVDTSKAELQAEFDTVIASGALPAPLRTWHRRRSSRRFPVEWFLRAIQPRSVSLMILVAREVAEDRAAGAPSSHREFVDPLTGLPGRDDFDRRLLQAVVRARENRGYAFAVLFVDLDGFKAVNDTLGHSEGDRLLSEFAGRLADCLRPGDFVARRGGDEFTVLVDNLHDPSDATRVAKRIRNKTALHADRGGHRLPVTASIGIALSQPKVQRPEELIDAADRAMYRAKAQGKPGFFVFDDAAEVG